MHQRSRLKCLSWLLAGKLLGSKQAEFLIDQGKQLGSRLGVALLEGANPDVDLAVALGEPGPGLSGLVDAVRRPECATAVGLALYGRHRRAERPVGSAMRAIGRVSEWFREFF